MADKTGEDEQDARGSGAQNRPSAAVRSARPTPTSPTTISFEDTAMNFVIAAAGNMVGGLVFVTLTRTSQAIGSGESADPGR